MGENSAECNILVKYSNFVGLESFQSGVHVLLMLNNRKQYTKMENCKSDLTKIECGVPQGSSLGPLLFLWYINDLPLASQFDTILFADDTFLAMSDNNLFKLQNRVNTELRKIDL